MIDPSSVTRELAAQGLAVREVQPGMWGCSFDVDGAKQEVLLFVSGSSGYFVTVSPIVSPQLDGKPSGLTQKTLATLLEIGSTVPLAKIDFKTLAADEVMYSALSYCSVQGWTGEKLHKRMRDVAILATRVETAHGRDTPAPVAT